MLAWLVCRSKFVPELSCAFDSLQFFTVLTITFLGLLACLILTFRFKYYLKTNLEDSMDKALQTYGSDSVVTQEVDKFQENVCSQRVSVTVCIEF